MSRREKWFAGAGGAIVLIFIGLIVAGNILSRKFEPYIRQQAEEYLRTRFRADVKIGQLHVQIPRLSPLRMAFTRGRGTIAGVDGEDIRLQMRGRPDLPPLFTMRKFSTTVDLGTIWATPKTVSLVRIEGLEIHVPPKGQRPRLNSHGSPNTSEPAAADKPTVLIERCLVKDAVLVLLPRDTKKKPLRFSIHDLKLESAGDAVAMEYDAQLTNPTPPGEIHSVGTFGPWNSDEPGDTPLNGAYTFNKADLGVFHGIAGILSSNGRFEGQLDSITARGEAVVPDFRLKRSGNPVPLRTRFEVLVDGTNGNTTLQPVTATLGSTNFKTSGAVFKNEGDARRQIVLDVFMPQGSMHDVLRLAMKGDPFMEGTLDLKTKLNIPPLTGPVKEKLRLDGSFTVTGGKFLRSTIQDQIDSLSRRGQGQPKNAEIEQVISRMAGKFKLDNAQIAFEDLTFGVPGADVQLAGTYDLNEDVLDFHGALSMRAKVSQTMSGWKRWLLKPVDPFFSKHGAGTYLRIKVVGNAKSPKFGLDH